VATGLGVLGLVVIIAIVALNNFFTVGANLSFAAWPRGCHRRAGYAIGADI
jgi:hypothetical protein